MILSQQCRMARAALNIGVRELANIADVSPNTVARLERGDALHTRTLTVIRGALEAAGVSFIELGAISALGGVGVRLNDGNSPKSSMSKLFETLWNVPNFRTYPAAAFADLVDVFEQYLNIISEQKREPDVWERLDLNDALNALCKSDVFGTFAYLRHAITPPDNQSPHYPISKDEASSVAALDLAYFRRCIQAIKSKGYQSS